MAASNFKDNSTRTSHHVKKNNTVKISEQETYRSVYETQDVYRNAFLQMPK